MLVLGRKIGEEIIIGHDTRLVVLDVRGSTVRLGFVAPREIPIHRAETALKIRPQAGEPDAVATRESRPLVHA